MSVLVRPATPRVWGNNIRPFQAVKPGPQVPTYTLKTWKPPVPEPLPPAPLLGLPSLLAVGALVLAQIWGLFKPSPKGTPDPGLGPEGPRKTTGEIRLDRFLNGEFVGAYVFDIEEVLETPVVTGVNSDGETYWAYGLTYKRAANGLTYTLPIGTAYSLPADNDFARFVNVSGTVLDPGIEGGALFPAPTPEIETGPLPAPFPWITPEELAALRPVPLPLPDGEPLADPANPQPQTTPLTVPAPLVAPTVPLLRPLPTGVQLLPGGTLPTPQPAAVPQTPQGTHYPATGLAIPANPPAPTLQGIAQEVGRVESKLNKLLNPATGNNFDRLELIYDTISGLFEFLTSITAGGSYTLEAPCETAEDGSPLVVEHTYEGALNSIGVLSNKIDAVAAMLQTVKNQKQPVCKAPPRQGQAVTVNFEEV